MNDWYNYLACTYTNHQKIQIMNQLIVAARKTIARFTALTIMLLTSAVLFAQDDTKKVDVNINAKSDNGFFSNPIVWVIGGAVFILLLVALMRNNSKSTS
jgi:hypothetical protein